MYTEPLILDDNAPLVRGVFLTLQDEEPLDAGYAPIKYGAIIEILARLMGESSQPPQPEVATFLKHYLEILEDATGMSDERTELEQLARDLYRDHKRVLDFVIEHGASSDFATAARTVFGENPDEFAVVDIMGRSYVFSAMNNKMVSFLPSDWYQACKRFSASWPGCEGWWASFPVIEWVQIWGSDKVPEVQLTLYAEVGPLSKYPLRKALIEGIQRTAADKGLDRIAFQSGAAEEGRSFSKFLKKNSVKVGDIHDADGIAVRQHAVAAIAMTQKAKEHAPAHEPTDEPRANTAFIDGVRQYVTNVKDLEIDLIDRINPFQTARAILSKAMDEKTLKEVAEIIAKKRISLTHEEARMLAERAIRFKQEHGRLPSLTSNDAWERQMAEGIAFLQRKAAEHV
jgi:hypothetical protein